MAPKGRDPDLNKRIPYKKLLFGRGGRSARAKLSAAFDIDGKYDI
jgi:hypothetical protein